MNKILFILFLSSYAHCQISGISFIEDKAVWYQFSGVYRPNPGPNPTPILIMGGYTSFMVLGDTIINNKFLQKVHITPDSYEMDTVCLEFNTYLYYESNRVYKSKLSGPDSTFKLIYDFNLVKGDSFIFNGYQAYNCNGGDTPYFIESNYTAYVDSIDTVFTRGSLHKWIRFSLFGNLQNPVIWEENLGDITYGFVGNDYKEIMAANCWGGFGTLYCFSQPSFNPNDCPYKNCLTTTIEQKRLEIISIFPNPANNEISLTLNENKIDKLFLYDLTGREVMQSKSNTINIGTLPKGIYFIKAQTEKGEFVSNFVKD